MSPSDSSSPVPHRPHPWPEITSGPNGETGRGGARALLHALRRRVRRLLRLRTGIKIDGVYFKELSAMPLARALSARGPGVKEYRVTFRDRSKQIIHATPEREYGDLTGRARLERYALARDRLRPGMRVLDIGSGTGYTSAWLAELVGAYGAVVALERDEESVEFAQRRYRVPNVAFEVREETSLDGETDESFDGIVWLREEWSEESRTAPELWRVLKPGGWLLMGPWTDAGQETEIERVLGSMASEDAGGQGRGRPTQQSDASRRGGPARVVIAARNGRDLLIEKVADPRS